MAKLEKQMGILGQMIDHNSSIFTHFTEVKKRFDFLETFLDTIKKLDQFSNYVGNLDQMI